MIGNEVATLVNEYNASGNYEIDFNASNLPMELIYIVYKLEKKL
jgi:hypothetical protein